MVTERAQRQMTVLLDEAEEAIRHVEWDVVRARVQVVLSLDPESADARSYLAAVGRTAKTELAKQAGAINPAQLQREIQGLLEQLWNHAHPLGGERRDLG